MRFLKKFPLAIAIAISIITTVSNAEFRQHGTHVHGEGELLIVLEGKKLDMSFRIPAMDIIGFEHKARTKEQKSSIQNAKTFLRKGDQVFNLGGSPECKLHRSSALFALTTHDHHDEGDQADTYKHEKNSHHGEEHAEFHVKYKYKCGKPEKLEKIVFNIFQHYAGIEKVKAAFIIFSKQSSATLTAETPAINIKDCQFSIGSGCLF